MLFITNREPQGSIRTRKGRKYKFDLNKNAPSNSIYCCQRLAENEYIEMGSEGLMTQLRECRAVIILYPWFFKSA